jgi:hypothetical protein
MTISLHIGRSIHYRDTRMRNPTTAHEVTHQVPIHELHNDHIQRSLLGTSSKKESDRIREILISLSYYQLLKLKILVIITGSFKSEIIQLTPAK